MRYSSVVILWVFICSVAHSEKKTFSVWAPHAKQAAVIGDFNGWDRFASLMSKGEHGTWKTTLENAKPGQEYRFLLDGGLERTDPMAIQVGSHPHYNARVYDRSAYAWRNERPPPKKLQELAIYEMHIGTFHDPNPHDDKSGTFYDAVKKLPHLKELGFNAVEVMPVAEFTTARSWGYNLAYPYAIEQDYGGPDGLKAFVDACHGLGLRVIVDIVHNHWGPSSDWALWQYDGWKEHDGHGGIYFYGKGEKGETPWGARPNYAEPEVRKYILNNFMMYLDEFRVDGFRWDDVYHMAHTVKHKKIPEGISLIEKVLDETKTRFPNVIHILENYHEGFERFGVGFWDFDFHHHLTEELSKELDFEKNKERIEQKLNGSTNRIIFIESHDEIARTKELTRSLVEFDPVFPHGDRGLLISMLAGVFTFTVPGTPMIFQGQEWGDTSPFDDHIPLDWNKTKKIRTRLNSFYKDLISLRLHNEKIAPILTGGTIEKITVAPNKNVVCFRRNKALESLWVLANIGSQKVSLKQCIPSKVALNDVVLKSGDYIKKTKRIAKENNENLNGYECMIFYTKGEENTP